MKDKKVTIIGGGAAGFFAAIHTARSYPAAHVKILEGSKSFLSKVLISGGGRCNVTNHTLDIRELCGNYPRGAQELRGAFSRFAVEDTIHWFQQRGVKLKTEPDGRMFPISDSSHTIADCLTAEATAGGVELQLQAKVVGVRTDAKNGFQLSLANETSITCDRLILTTGGNKNSFALAASLGHTIVEPAPSLFTFEIEHPLLTEMAGVSFPDAAVRLDTPEKVFGSTGPILITHWGLSGPAVIKLSAVAARELQRNKYKATVRISFNRSISKDQAIQTLAKAKRDSGKKQIGNLSLFDVPRRFWGGVISAAAIPHDKRIADCTKQDLQAIATLLTDCELPVSGKGVFKEEFVTCGGVSLREVDFRTMQSKIVPGLYFAGEVLDIDGITGGFNFQSAWTTGYLAGTNCLSSTLPHK